MHQQMKMTRTLAGQPYPFNNQFIPQIELDYWQSRPGKRIGFSSKGNKLCQRVPDNGWQPQWDFFFITILLCRKVSKTLYLFCFTRNFTSWHRQLLFAIYAIAIAQMALLLYCSIAQMLFNIYINDLPQFYNVLCVKMYADDTALL